MALGCRSVSSADLGADVTVSVWVKQNLHVCLVDGDATLGSIKGKIEAITQLSLNTWKLLTSQVYVQDLTDTALYLERTYGNLTYVASNIDGFPQNYDINDGIGVPFMQIPLSTLGLSFDVAVVGEDGSILGVQRAVQPAVQPVLMPVPPAPPPPQCPQVSSEDAAELVATAQRRMRIVVDGQDFGKTFVMSVSSGADVSRVYSFTGSDLPPHLRGHLQLTHHSRPVPHHGHVRDVLRFPTTVLKASIGGLFGGMPKRSREGSDSDLSDINGSESPQNLIAKQARL